MTGATLTPSVRFAMLAPWEPGASRVPAMQAVADDLEPTLVQQQALLSMLRHALDFFVHITPDGRFLFVNKFVVGLGPADLENRTIYDFLDPSTHDVARSTIERVVATGQQQSYESMGAGPNNEVAYYVTRVTPVVTDERVTSVVLIATDVSQLKRVEAAHADSEAMLQHVLTTTGYGIWWWDAQSDDSWMDGAASAIFEAPPSLPKPELLCGRVHEGDRERVLAHLAAARTTGAFPAIEYRVTRLDGTIRWVSESGQSCEGKPRIVGGVIDITERKHLEGRLAHAEKLESVGRLAGGIAHDFNNMLTVISSNAEMVLSALPGAAAFREELTEIRNAADRSIALTRQLLAFARQQIIQPKIVDFNEIVRQFETLLRRTLGERIEVVSILSARKNVRIDVNQFEQVLLNLAVNSRDAMPEGGVLTFETSDIEIEPGTSKVPTGSYVRITISDTGTGITQPDLERVFDPFYTTKGNKGTGLGLSMVYGAVVQNGGHISVESSLGAGTSFQILLPSAGKTIDQSRRDLQGSAGGETILVAEDEPLVRAIVVKTLTRAGYTVLQASDGVEALQLARQHGSSIRLLITDVVMPRLGGHALVEQMSSEHSALPVLFMSGYTDDSNVHQGVLDGSVDFLQKPFTSSGLLERVRRALDRSS